MTNDERFDRIDETFRKLEEMIRKSHDAVVEHIQSVGGALHTQMQEMEKRIRGDFGAAQKAVEARLDRHGGLLRGGGIQITRLIEWSERVDGIIAQQQADIADLKRRLDERDRRSPL